MRSSINRGIIVFVLGLLALELPRRISDPGSSSPVRWGCRGMEIIMTRGWGHIISGSRWLHEPQPVCHQPVGLGLAHCAGRYRPGGPPFSFPVCRSCRWKDLRSGYETLFFRVALAPRNRTKQRPVRGVGVSTSCGAVSTRGTTSSEPGLLELWLC